MDGQVGAVELLFRIKTDADGALDAGIHDKATDHGDQDAEQGANQLAGQADAAQASEGVIAKDAGGNAAPGATQAMQRPHAEHVVDLPAVLRHGKELYEQG